MSGSVPEYTEEEIAEALREADGLITYAAKKLGCRRATVREYLKRYPALQAVLAEAKEAVLDDAEKSLMAKFRSGNLTAAIFILKCLGKERGYVERAELTGANGSALGSVTLDDIDSMVKVARANAAPKDGGAPVAASGVPALKIVGG